MSQTSGYDFALPKALVGMLADNTPNVVDSFAAEAVVHFGAGVIAGTDPDNQVKTAVAAGKFRGVALRDHTRLTNRTTGIAEYAAKDTVSVLRKGRVWVEVTEAVVAEDAAYCDVSSTDVGKFCKTSSGGNLATGGKFLYSAGAGELAVLEL